MPSPFHHIAERSGACQRRQSARHIEKGLETRNMSCASDVPASCKSFRQAIFSFDLHQCASAWSCDWVAANLTFGVSARRGTNGPTCGSTNPVGQATLSELCGGRCPMIMRIHHFAAAVLAILAIAAL